MPTASKVLVRKGESALGSTSATTATMSSATETSSSLKAEEGIHDMSSNKLPVEDDTFGFVKIYGETTSLRYEIQQLKKIYEQHGRSPTSSENLRLYELCRRLREIRRDPTKAHINMGNVKPGEQLSDDIVSELDSFNFEWKPINRNRGQKTLQDRIQELKAYRGKHGPLPIGTKKRKGNQELSRFSTDLRQSRRHPEKPKYQLSERDISELDSFGFEWELTGTATEQKRKNSSDVNSRVVSSEVRVPTQTRSGRTIKRKSPVDLGSISSKKVKEESKGDVEEEDDNVFGVVKIDGETTSLRFELQQLKIFHETYGKSPTPNENRRLNKLCSRLRQVRRDPKASFYLGNRKPGEKLSDEIVSMLNSFKFDWEPLVSIDKPKQYPNTQGRIQELKDVRGKYGPSLKGMNEKRKNSISKFCSDLRQSRKNPENPKYQLSESDVSELDSFGFEWDNAPVLPKKTKAKVRILSTTIEKLAGPPANGERYTQMEVIQACLVHGKSLVNQAIIKSSYLPNSTELKEYFPGTNQCFSDDILKELLCKHKVGSDEWHEVVGRIVQTCHGPSKSQIYKLFDYTEE